MKPHEIVTAAVEFRKPPRMPVQFGCFGVDDSGWLPTIQSASFKPAVKGMDEWGCVWEQTEMENMGQVTGHPITDVADLSRLQYPDYNDESRYVNAEKGLAEGEAQGKYMFASIFMILFERMHTLCGFENCLAGLLCERKAMEELADRILDVHLTFVRNVQRRYGRRIHGFCMSEDWGTQSAAFISFDLWMDFFYPRYKKLFDAMHSGGQHVWVHSCGKINEVIEGFIKSGVNVLNLQQPRALGIADIGRRYAGRVTFQSLADIQATLPTGNREMVDQDVAELMKHWATPKGGFVFADYGGDAAIGVKDPAIKRYMYDAFSKASKELYGAPLPAPTA